MKRTERLDEATTPDGTVLSLYRHDGEYYIRAGAIELMSTRRFHSEERLADLVCEPLRHTSGSRVLIGGLGLGFTLRAALRTLPADATVTVVELLDAVVRWNLHPEYDISVDALADPRVTLLRTDVARVLRDSPGRFDGIMMDVDNGSDAITTAGNRALYQDAGVLAALAALRPGGSVAYWSATADAPLEDTMRRAGLDVITTTVRAWGRGGPRHTIVQGRRPT